MLKDRNIVAIIAYFPFLIRTRTVFVLEDFVFPRLPIRLCEGEPENLLLLVRTFTGLIDFVVFGAKLVGKEDFEIA